MGISKGNRDRIIHQLTLFYHTTGLPASFAFSDGYLYYSVPAVEESDKPCLYEAVTQTAMWASLHADQSFLFHEDKYHRCYLIASRLSFIEGFIIAGPFVTEEFSSHSVRNLLIELELPMKQESHWRQHLNSLPKRNSQQIHYLMESLSLSVTASPARASSLEKHEEEWIPSVNNSEAFPEEMPVHYPYELEQEFLYHLKNGDERVFTLLTEFDSYSPYKLGATSTRANKNSLIVLVSLLVRACIEAGAKACKMMKTGERIVQEIESSARLQSPYMLKEETIDIVSIFLREIKEVLANSHSPVVRQIISYIEMNICENVTLNDIAEQCGRHPNYISGLFKKETGQTLQEYLLNERIKRAKYFLAYSDHSLIDITHYSGFQSQSYFAYQFKKWTGTTPRIYRHKYQG
ncbi:AraC family transcriptional regulator [Marinococcus sp. PL1-022]|uniref:AraC family transcriptional regulator n=1 Tax=Marinococcus sp. PL1-022 TaxID=3095363 RepID=UPI0029C164C0|nr:AraC family transcriptional regulator [Marinococcus sp. PL1-022]MDX6153897.1 AraC family transcriptional regulator [Marinococcus sp. PL1-022]